MIIYLNAGRWSEKVNGSVEYNSINCFIICLFFYCVCVYYRNMVLAERCALLSAEVLKSQAKYSEAAALLIKMTSEVSLIFVWMCAFPN